jgi:hypothetical protein
VKLETELYNFGASNERMRSMNIQYVEKLSLHEQFRLVEIAHETSDSEIRKAALSVLQKYLNPFVMGSTIADHIEANL